MATTPVTTSSEGGPPPSPPPWGTFAFWVLVLPPTLLAVAIVWGCVRLIRGSRHS